MNYYVDYLICYLYKFLGIPGISFISLLREVWDIFIVNVWKVMINFDTMIHWCVICFCNLSTTLKFLSLCPVLHTERFNL